MWLISDSVPSSDIFRLLDILSKVDQTSKVLGHPVAPVRYTDPKASHLSHCPFTLPPTFTDCNEVSEYYHCDIDTSREKQVQLFRNTVFNGK